MELLHNKEWYEQVQTYLALPREDQRFLYYNYNISRDNHFISRKETDTHIYISLTRGKLCFNKSLYCRYDNVTGLTWDKEAKKLKVWFGKQYYSFDTIFEAKVLETFNLQWVEDLQWTIRNLITNTVFEKILQGKITTQEEIVKHYLRSISMGKYDFDIDKLIATASQVGSIRTLKPYLQYCNDPVGFVEKYAVAYLTQDIKSLAEYGEKFDEKFDINLTPEENSELLQKYRLRSKQFMMERQIDQVLLF